MCKYPFYHFLKNSWQLPRLANPQEAKLKICETEPRAGKSSDKWVKSHEMPQISYRRDFQWGLWVIGSHTSLQSCTQSSSSKWHYQASLLRGEESREAVMNRVLPRFKGLLMYCGWVDSSLWNWQGVPRKTEGSKTATLLEQNYAL